MVNVQKYKKENPSLFSYTCKVTSINQSVLRSASIQWHIERQCSRQRQWKRRSVASGEEVFGYPLKVAQTVNPTFSAKFQPQRNLTRTFSHSPFSPPKPCGKNYFCYRKWNFFATSWHRVALPLCPCHFEHMDTHLLCFYCPAFRCRCFFLPYHLCIATWIQTLSDICHISYIMEGLPTLCKSI